MSSLQKTYCRRHPHVNAVNDLNRVGGYNPKVVAKCVIQCMYALLGDDLPYVRLFHGAKYHGVVTRLFLYTLSNVGRFCFC